MQAPCAVLPSLEQCQWWALAALCSKASSALTGQHFLLHHEAKGRTYASGLPPASRQHRAHGLAKEQSHADGLSTTVGSLHWSCCCIMWETHAVAVVPQIFHHMACRVLQEKKTEPRELPPLVYW